MTANEYIYSMKGRNAFIALLFLVFVLNTFVFNAFYVYTLYSVKEEMKEKIKRDLNQEDITEICLTEKEYSELEWKDDHQECIVKGDWYDIIEIEETNEGYLIRAISDTKEKKAIADLIKHSGEKSPIKKSRGFSALFSVQRPDETSVDLMLFVNADRTETIYIDNYSSTYSTNTTPPPRIG